MSASSSNPLDKSDLIGNKSLLSLTNKNVNTSSKLITNTAIENSNMMIETTNFETNLLFKHLSLFKESQ